MQPNSHIHTPGSVRKCEGMNPHTPKWKPFWELEFLQSLEFLKNDFFGENSLD